MVQTTRGWLEVDEGRIYYECAGTGAPLVFCHAGFVDGRMWDAQWAPFAERYRVVRFDMRGYGRSDRATGSAPRRQDLVRLLDQLDLGRAHLVGASLGGELALDLALDQPERVASLTLVGVIPGGFELQGAPPPELIEMGAALQAGDLERASELQLRVWVDGGARQPEQVDPRVRAQAAEMNRIAVANGAITIEDAAPLDPPAVGRLQSVRCPALIIVGALDHPELLRGAQLLCDELPQATLVTIPETAHVPNMERPAEFNHAVLGWLAQLER